MQWRQVSGPITGMRVRDGGPLSLTVRDSHSLSRLMLPVTVCAASVCTLDRSDKLLRLLCPQRLRTGRKASRTHRGGRAHIACVSAARRSERERTAVGLALHNGPSLPRPLLLIRRHST